MFFGRPLRKNESHNILILTKTRTAQKEIEKLKLGPVDSGVKLPFRISLKPNSSTNNFGSLLGSKY